MNYAMLKQVKRKMTDDELIAEIDEAMKDHEFVKAVKRFIEATSR